MIKFILLTLFTLSIAVIVLAQSVTTAFGQIGLLGNNITLLNKVITNKRRP